MSLGPWQLVIIVLVVLLLFGGGRLSEIGKGLGEGIRNFKKGLSNDDTKNAEDEPAEPHQLPRATGPVESPSTDSTEKSEKSEKN